MNIRRASGGGRASHRRIAGEMDTGVCCFGAAVRETACVNVLLRRFHCLTERTWCELRVWRRGSSRGSRKN